MTAISIGFHDIAPESTPALSAHAMRYCLDPNAFHEHVSAIHQQLIHGTYTITQFRAGESQGIPVFLTFDDGGAGAFAFGADNLERHGWRGHFFITTDWIGTSRFMTHQQICDLHVRGHVIDSHSCSHPERMSRLSPGALLKEWRNSCARLADIVSDRVVVASVPDGYFSRNVARAAAAAGIEVLFTSEPTVDAKNVDGCVVLGRYTIQRWMPPSASGAIAAGQYWPRWRQTAGWQAKKAIKAIAGEHYLSARKFLLKRRAARGGP